MFSPLVVRRNAADFWLGTPILEGRKDLDNLKKPNE